MCFGGSKASAPPPPPPPPPTNVPAPGGNDREQRFQQIRAGLQDGTIIDDKGLLAQKGSTVLGETK